jgi:hypothetical protein
MILREIHDFLSPDEPEDHPQFPVRPPDGSKSLSEWAHPVLVFLTRVLEAHESSLTDEEALAAQQAIQRVRQLFTLAEECEREEGRLAVIDREAARLEGQLHVQEHVLGALARRYHGMLTLNTNEIEHIPCAELRSHHIDLATGESYVVWYLADETSEEDVRRWAEQMEMSATSRETRGPASRSTSGDPH